MKPSDIEKSLEKTYNEQVTSNWEEEFEKKLETYLITQPSLSGEKKI